MTAVAIVMAMGCTSNAGKGSQAEAVSVATRTPEAVSVVTGTPEAVSVATVTTSPVPTPANTIRKVEYLTGPKVEGQELSFIVRAIEEEDKLRSILVPPNTQTSVALTRDDHDNDGNKDLVGNVVPERTWEGSYSGDEDTFIAATYDHNEETGILTVEVELPESVVRFPDLRLCIWQNGTKETQRLLDCRYLNQSYVPFSSDMKIQTAPIVSKVEYLSGPRIEGQRLSFAVTAIKEEDKLRSIFVRPNTRSSVVLTRDDHDNDGNKDLVGSVLPERTWEGSYSGDEDTFIAAIYDHDEETGTLTVEVELPESVVRFPDLRLCIWQNGTEETQRLLDCRYLNQ